MHLGKEKKKGGRGKNSTVSQQPFFPLFCGYWRSIRAGAGLVLATDQNEGGGVIFCACRPSGGLIPACYCILHHVQKSFCNSLSLPGYDRLWKWLSVGLRVWKKCTNALMRSKGQQRLRNFIFLFFLNCHCLYTPPAFHSAEQTLIMETDILQKTGRNKDEQSFTCNTTDNITWAYRLLNKPLKRVNQWLPVIPAAHLSWGLRSCVIAQG